MLGVLAFAGMFASIPTVTLAPGTNLPMVSLGTGSGQKGDVANATETWIRVGGVAIDTAYIYDDESDIAAGISRAGIGASDLFITTKIPCTDYAQAKKNIATNLALLKASSGEPPFSASLLVLPAMHSAGGVYKSAAHTHPNLYPVGIDRIDLEGNPGPIP